MTSRPPLRVLVLPAVAIVASIIAAAAPLARGEPPAAAAAAKADPYKTFKAVGTAAADAADDLKTASPEAKGLLEAIARTNAALRQKWAAANNGEGADLAPAYLATLEHDRALLAAARQVKDDDQRVPLLRDVHDDLEAKLAFADKGMNLGGAFPSTVEVKVTTVSADGAEVNGYQVNCNPRRYEDDPKPMFPFGDLSSPSSAKLPPGAYFLWLERGGKRVTTRYIRVGMDGQKTDTVKVEVPAAPASATAPAPAPAPAEKDKR